MEPTMMADSRSYIEVAKSLLDDPDWGPYIKDQASMPNQPAVAGDIATKLFYLGHIRKAQQVSKFFAGYSESEFGEFNSPHPHAYYHLFLAGLYWSLGKDPTNARKAWHELVEGVDDLEDEEILVRKAANQWVMQSYGYAKLNEYAKVEDPARKGRLALEEKKGTHKAPHRNSREFALAPLLVKLAKFKLNDEKASQEEVQEALQEYKSENVRYGRLGYPVIFDLQFSYPDVFDPVLPGDDPEKD